LQPSSLFVVAPQAFFLPLKEKKSSVPLRNRALSPSLLFSSLLFTTMLTRGGTSFGTTILLPSLFTSLGTKSRMLSRIWCCKSAWTQVVYSCERWQGYYRLIGELALIVDFCFI
jgi:hypothetical protein